MSQSNAVEKVLTLSDAFTANSAFEVIRPLFRKIPSPQEIKLAVGKVKLTISREKSKGAGAKWFLNGYGRRFEGTKREVHQEASFRLVLAARGL